MSQKQSEIGKVRLYWDVFSAVASISRMTQPDKEYPSLLKVTCSRCSNGKTEMAWDKDTVRFLYDSQYIMRHALHVTTYGVALNAERETILTIVWLASSYDLIEDNYAYKHNRNHEFSSFEF